MRLILIASALAMSSPLLAEVTPPDDPAMPEQTMPPADPMAAPPSTPVPPDSAMPAPPAPSNAEPTVTMGAPVTNAPPPAPAEYPRCSKTVKDECRQPGGK